MVKDGMNKTLADQLQGVAGTQSLKVEVRDASSIEMTEDEVKEKYSVGKNLYSSKMDGRCISFSWREKTNDPNDPQKLKIYYGGNNAMPISYEEADKKLKKYNISEKDWQALKAMHEADIAGDAVRAKNREAATAEMLQKMQAALMSDPASEIILAEKATTVEAVADPVEKVEKNPGNIPIVAQAVAEDPATAVVGEVAIKDVTGVEEKRQAVDVGANKKAKKRSGNSNQEAEKQKTEKIIRALKEKYGNSGTHYFKEDALGFEREIAIIGYVKEGEEFQVEFSSLKNGFPEEIEKVKLAEFEKMIVQYGREESIEKREELKNFAVAGRDYYEKMKEKTLIGYSEEMKKKAMEVSLEFVLRSIIQENSKFFKDQFEEKAKEIMKNILTENR